MTPPSVRVILKDKYFPLEIVFHKKKKRQTTKTVLSLLLISLDTASTIERKVLCFRDHGCF